MKFLDEYRDGEAAGKLAAAVARAVTRPWTIMEVCGGQTHTIVKYGIDRLLPPGVELVHGPGCPVCVTSLDCPAFGKECTPQTPLGATMVSSEGACAAYHAYSRHLEPRTARELPLVGVPT